MTARFLDPLQVAREGGRWRLLGRLRYESALLKRTVAVPAGFDTDFASVPRLPFMFWFLGARVYAPAVIHDFLYRTACESRADADAVFYEAMDAAREVGPIARWIMWAGVRVGGHWSYDQRHPENQ